MSHLRPLIIIGTGLAGYHLAKSWRLLNPTAPLIMLSQEPGHYYSKPQLSTARTQGKTASALIMTPVEIMREQLNAQIFAHTQVTHIDPIAREIQCETPEGTHTFAYEHLVLATGATPNNYPVAPEHPRHFRINHWHEYDAFMQDFSHYKQITLVGSGLVSCELANDWSDGERVINVVTPDPYPLSRFLPEPIGIALQTALCAKGINWYTQREIMRIESYETSFDCHLSTGKTLITDALVTAIGLSPNIALAEAAQIQTQQGFVVNEHLATSQSHIYALGDCAQINGSCRFFIAPLLPCARALAQTLNGNPTSVSLPIVPIVLKVDSYPIVMVPPSPSTTGEWHFETAETGMKGIFYDADHQIKGYALTGSFQSERSTIHQSMMAAEQLLSV
jgi:rubredoxin-NAD+ reductase